MFDINPFSITKRNLTGKSWMKIFLSITIFISQIGQSFRDSANDAWAIDISQKEERGKINGVKNTRFSLA